MQCQYCRHPKYEPPKVSAYAGPIVAPGRAHNRAQSWPLAVHITEHTPLNRASDCVTSWKQGRELPWSTCGRRTAGTRWRVSGRNWIRRAAPTHTPSVTRYVAHCSCVVGHHTALCLRTYSVQVSSARRLMVSKPVLRSSHDATPNEHISRVACERPILEQRCSIAQALRGDGSWAALGCGWLLCTRAPGRSR